ncbi:hypothetical protein [uncultured Bradyrhizobium sp.]|jgi:hypothetical protein|uniref:hypothetical protein n=1 Tax=uncultured Bradyrhizobium sp. TaxID=199684 RepID=UPI0026213FAB|nr:hypothetical protein [uncultured Bradyrhizobium sp.]
MNGLQIGFTLIWVAGLAFLFARALNYSRLVLNNLAPGETCWEPSDFRLFFSFRRFRLFGNYVEPTHLTDLGREYQKRVRQTDVIAFFWTLGGLVALAIFFS